MASFQFGLNPCIEHSSWVMGFLEGEPYGSANFHEHVCAATIISQNYVVTCAHCIVRNSNVPDFFSILVGTSNIDIDNSHNRYCVEKFAIHPYYQQKDMDVAVVKLKRPLNLSNEKIKIIALPEINAPFISGGILFTAAG